MSEYWGSSRWRFKLTQDLQQILSGDLNPIQIQIDNIQGAIANQIAGMEADNPTRKGLEFISNVLENYQEESELIVELAKEAAKTANSVNRGYNSRKYNSSTKLRQRASEILEEIELEEGIEDFTYKLQLVQAEMKGEEPPPSNQYQVGTALKDEYVKTAKAFVETLLPEFAEEIVYKFAAALAAKETSNPLANSLRYEIAADLKEYDNLPIPDEFEGNIDEIQPQIPSYKGRPFQPVAQNELGFQPSSGNLAPKIGDKFNLGIAVVMVVEAGAIVVLKGAQLVSAAIGAITSLATSVAAWCYLAVLAVVAIIVAYFIVKATKLLESLTGQYIYMFGVRGDDIDISFATVRNKITRRTVDDTVLNVYNRLQASSPFGYQTVFAFVVDDEDTGKPENFILNYRWITAGYTIAFIGKLGLVKLDKNLWKPTFDSLNSQVDELFRFKEL